MWHVGMDVHWRSVTICILDENGKQVKMVTTRGPWQMALEELARLKVPFDVCFEASCGYGNLHDRLSRIAARVVVAHPGQLRLIFRSKKKNDRVDAQKLATLLFLNEVPAVHVPSVDVRSWRSMIEHRQRLLAERTRVKNALRALLRSHDLRPPKGLWSRKGLAWLAAQTFPTVMDAAQRDIHLDRLASVQTMVRRAEKALAQAAAGHPGMKLLMAIPGVGIRTTEAVIAYVDDPQRFGNVKTIGSYFGMIPCQDQSGGKNHLGHITRQVPATVRKLLTEAAWQGIRRSAVIRARFERIQQGDPDRKKIAVVATAHYLLRVMLAMLKSGEVWRTEAA